jgi:hypothetical protein
VILEVKHQLVEVSLVGKALNHRDIEHVCEAGVPDGENLFFTFSSMLVHHLPDKVDAVDYVQAGAVVPVYEEGAGIVDSRDGSFGTDGRCLHIVHLKQFHAGARRVAGAECVKLVSPYHSHAASSFSGAPFFQLELPERFFQENLSFCLVVTADEAQPKEEAAECVFLVVDFLFGCADPLLILGELADGCNEVGVGFDLVRLRHFGEPRECDLVFGNFNAKVVNAERLLDEAAFCREEVCQVSDRCFVERQAD